jgi:hypothetical protein
VLPLGLSENWLTATVPLPPVVLAVTLPLAAVPLLLTSSPVTLTLLAVTYSGQRFEVRLLLPGAFATATYQVPAVSDGVDTVRLVALLLAGVRLVAVPPGAVSWTFAPVAKPLRLTVSVAPAPAVELAGLTPVTAGGIQLITTWPPPVLVLTTFVWLVPAL